MDATRRGLLLALPGLTFLRHLEARPRLRITGFELLPVRATERTVWLFVRLKTDAGLSGLGEASDAFGFANTTKQDAARMENEFRSFSRISRPLSKPKSPSYGNSGTKRSMRHVHLTPIIYMKHRS